MTYITEDQRTALLEIDRGYKPPQIEGKPVVATLSDEYQAIQWRGDALCMQGAMAEAERFLLTVPGQDAAIEVLREFRFVRYEGALGVLSLAERHAAARAFVEGALAAHPDKLEDLKDLARYPGLGRWVKTLPKKRVVKELAPKKRPGRPSFGCICTTTGETYATPRQAAEAAGIALSSLYAHLNGDPRYKTVRGQTYAYMQPKE